MIVGVLAGGVSSERDISLRSGMAVYNALKDGGYQVKFLDIFDDAYDTIKNARIDIAFLALHGRFGEDGTIQAMLERLGIPYTGSGVRASRLALDKIAAKKVFEKNGIPTPGYAVFDRHSYRLEDARRLGLPIVVKPQLEGSSMGLSIVRAFRNLKRALYEAFGFGDRVLLEQYIDGREITVGILGREALPLVEIISRRNVYDTDAKYRDRKTRYLVPAPLDEEVFERARKLGLKVHSSLGLKDLSRVDMRVDGSGNIFVLEANSIPGMTERSLLPKAASAHGLDFRRLCAKLLMMAREK